MENRPFTKLFIALAVFVTVACILAQFRHGFSAPALFGALVGTLGSAACLDQFIWPGHYGKRFVLFLELIAVTSFTTYFFLKAFDLPRSYLLPAFGLALGFLRRFYSRGGRRNLDAKTLQARLLQKRHDET